MKSLAFALFLVVPLGAQVPAPAPPTPPPQKPLWLRLPVEFSGQASSTGELYSVNGIASRRPGSAWRMSFSPQMTFLGELSVGMDMLVSSEGNEARQSISQFGLNPKYKWATFHIGNFTQNYTPYTLQGTRLLGGGIDLAPGIFRVSLQGGTSQRMVAADAANLTYRRSLYAGSVGIGRPSSNFIDIVLMRAKDDPESLAPALSDTLLLDTIPAALRPRIETRPQENSVIGLRSRIGLFANRLVLNGEAAGALITRDVESPEATATGVGGTDGALAGLMPLHLSTSGDYAYKVDAETNFGRGNFSAGYEHVGAGYTSLGLSYLINDRKAYNASGSVRLIGGHLTLQGNYQHQNDNLLNQKLATTNRDALTGTAVVMLGRRFSTSVTALINTTKNDATVDTFRVDNRALAFMTNSSLASSLFGRATTFSVSYALQRTADDNAVFQVPAVTVHNVSTSAQVTLTKVLSVAPTASLALTQNPSAETQKNLNFGFRGQARLRKVRASASAMQTYSNARGVFGLNGQLNYTLPWQGNATLQSRFNKYDAIGNRPAFTESFTTLGLARSF